MKTLLLLSVLLITTACLAQETKKESANINESINPAYDSLLAKRLGANDNGMKKYFMAFLKAGKNRPQDSLKRAELQAAHMKNIQRMADEGKLILAGPFLDDQNVRGIYIFDVATLEEARALTESDPAIQAGSLEMELRPWFGSAALCEVPRIHKTLVKKK